MVNSVGESLDLSAGKVSQAIAAKAGPQLQSACNDLIPLEIGKIKETPGFGLPCNQILHCNCWPYNDAESILVCTK